MGRPAGPIKWRAVAKTAVAAVLLAVLYIVSGAAYKVQQLAALEADPKALPDLRAAHQAAFAVYGRLPVAYLFGSAYADYIGYPVTANRRMAELRQERQRMVDQLRTVVFGHPDSPWADNAFYELIRVAGAVADETSAPRGGAKDEVIDRRAALEYCREFLRDYRDSPYGPLVAEKMLALAQTLGDEAQVKAAYGLLVNTYPGQPVAAQAAQKMMAYYAQSGRLEEAVVAAETALQAMSADADPETLLAIGDFLRDHGRFAPARRCYQQVLAAVRTAIADLDAGQSASAEATFEYIRARGALRRLAKQAQASLDAIKGK